MRLNDRKRTFGRVPSNDSHSLFRIFTERIWIARDAKFRHADKEDCNQTALSIVGRTCQKVRFFHIVAQI